MICFGKEPFGPEVSWLIEQIATNEPRSELLLIVIRLCRIRNEGPSNSILVLRNISRK